jgi:RNA polymerase sigma factor (sigma-70 family)
LALFVTPDHRREAIVLQGTAEQLIPEQSHRPRHAKPDQLAILPVGDAAGRSYEDLYVEHAPVARAVALSMVPRDVADDIVAEAFTRVLGAIRAGGGPGVAFRAYLLAAVRNTANDWLRASRRTTAVGDVEHDLDERVPEENLGLARLSRGPEAEAEARVEAQLVAKAFAKLPERWQAVLWQLEVEARAPAAVAPAFGLSANGVSALAVRAREGLRQAYLAEHVGANIPAACRAYAEALSADTRGRLSRRRQAAVHDHLDQCASCHSLAGELTELNGRLGAIITPAALAAALAGSGHSLLHFSTGPAIKAGAAKAGAAHGAAAKAGAAHGAAAKAGAGAKAATGAKSGLGAKAGMSAKAVLSSQWKLHPLTATAAATAGLAAAGGMVFAVGVSPMSPFHTQQVTERPAAASSDVIAPALGYVGKHGSPAGTASPEAAAAAAAAGSVAPSSATASGLGADSQGSGADYVPRHAADGNTGSADRGASPGATPDPVGSLIGGVGSTVQGVTGGVGSTVQGVTTGVGSTVQGVTTGVGSVVQGVTGGAGATVTGLGQTVDGVTQGLGSTVNQATTGLGSVISGVTQALSGGNATVTAVGDTAGALVQGVGGAVDGATGTVGTTVGGATAGVGNVTANAGAAVSGVTSGAGAAVSGVTSGAGAAVSGVTSGLGSGVSGLLGGGKS